MLSQGRSTPLHLAARNGHYEAVKVLIEFEADVNVTDEVNTNICLVIVSTSTMVLQKRDTPLHDAAWAGHADVIGILVNSGAIVDATNNVRTHTMCLHMCICYLWLNCAVTFPNVPKFAEGKCLLLCVATLAFAIRYRILTNFQGT